MSQVHALRAANLAALAVVAGLLGACHKHTDEVVEAKATDVPQVVANQRAAAAAVENKYGTPVKDRVGTIGLLNKRNNETVDLVLKTGESRRVGNAVVKLATCEKTLPWERPSETGAFVQLFVEERAKLSDPLAWHKVFSGWLFKNSPSLNVVQHPVYDVWVKDCAMKFPGEEEDPAAAKSAAKASGKAHAKAPAADAPDASPAPAAADANPEIR